MIEANVRIPTPVNEPVFAYAPGSPERAQLKEAIRLYFRRVLGK